MVGVTRSSAVIAAVSPRTGADGNLVFPLADGVAMGHDMHHESGLAEYISTPQPPQTEVEKDLTVDSNSESVASFDHKTTMPYSLAIFNV